MVTRSNSFPSTARRGSASGATSPNLLKNAAVLSWQVAAGQWSSSRVMMRPLTSTSEPTRRASVPFHSWKGCGGTKPTNQALRTNIDRCIFADPGKNRTAGNFLDAVFPAADNWRDKKSMSTLICYNCGKKARTLPNT